MKPTQRRTGWPRLRRITVNAVLVPAWVIVAFIGLNMFANYSEVGNLVLLALVMFFSLWAWWYGEDRDRRHHLNGDGNGDANGQLSTRNEPNGD